MDLVLVINGPNLNSLGKRNVDIYGTKTLLEINHLIEKRAKDIGIEVLFFQSNHEGELVDYIQKNAKKSAKKSIGIVVNPGALTHTSVTLLDALLDANVPYVEVHLSNIHKREDFRKRSITVEGALGSIAGLGYMSYIYALDFLKQHLDQANKS